MVALVNGEVVDLRIDLDSGVVFDAIPGWAEVLGRPPRERQRLLRDPRTRDQLAGAAAAVPRNVMDYVSPHLG